MSERGSIYVGKGLKSLHTSPDFGAYTKVRLIISDESYVEAGNDTGLTLEAECPWATQATANAVLASLSGFSYRPYTGDGAVLDPAAELGDGITTNGFFGGLYRAEKRFARKSRTNIAAPTSGEADHEIQHKSEADRKFTRKMRQVSAELALKMDAIYAKVIDDSHSFGWELKSDGMEWQANGSTVMKLGANGLEVTGTIKGGSVITGTLNVGGADITAATLRSGANSGYNWANGSYGGYTPWNYSLTGGGYGFNFNNSTYQYTSSYPAHFVCGTLYAKNGIHFGGSPLYLTSANVRLANGNTTTLYYVSYTDG